MTTPTDKSEVPFNPFAQSQLDALRKDFDVQKGWLSEWKRVAEACQSQLTDLRAQVERLHADGAVMRQAIEDFVHNVKHSHVAGWGDVSKDTVADNSFQELSKALSTSCGADLLARYREAVELLKDVDLCPRLLSPDPNGKNWKWHDRRDTLLARVKCGS